MKILIKNCNLISVSAKRDKYEKEIDILIEDRIIKKIGKNINENVEKIIDGTDKIVMPGLINTHAHISMSIFRETLDGYNLQEWLNNKIWPMEDKLTEEDIYYASLLSCVEMIKTGTTMINDMYFMTENIIKAAKETNIRMQTTRTLMDMNNDGDKRIKELEELIKDNKEKSINFNVGIHGLYTSNENYIKKCIEIAKQYNLPVHMHFCENNQEVKDIKSNYKVESAVDILEKYFRNVHTILAHCVKLEDNEIERLGKLNIYVSHCPVSNLKLGCGVAKVKEMMDNNICVSLGTDGQGSGSNLDLFETMKFTALLQKGINENPKDLTAYEVIKMATINGAKTLNMENKIGSIEEGKYADLIIINMNECITQPINNIFSEIVYNVKGHNVETTIIDGNILMENRKLKNINEKIINEKCESVIKRIEKN